MSRSIYLAFIDDEEIKRKKGSKRSGKNCRRSKGWRSGGRETARIFIVDKES